MTSAINAGTSSSQHERVSALMGQNGLISRTKSGLGLDSHAHLPDRGLGRWWFASSVFPMISGTLGPVASACSICALVRPWRQLGLPPSNDFPIYIKDPTWLLTLNAVQLAIALIANVILLLNMGRRVRFSIAQPVTVVGWFLSSVCLAALLAVAAGPELRRVDLPDGVDPDIIILSGAFWYGTWAAMVYLISALLMSITFYGAVRGHYPKDFNLNSSQRTLMLQTILILMYILIGALVYSRLEGWAYLDSVYWSTVTIFTIGFGDFVPTSLAGEILLVPYSLIGVISLALVIGSIRSMVLERAGRRLDVRMLEKERQSFVARLAAQDSHILHPISGDKEALHASHGNSHRHPTMEYARREAEFNLMRRIQRKVGARRRWLAMVVSLFCVALIWFVGAAVFYAFEGEAYDWSYGDGTYFAFVSLSTIGYGNFVPKTPGGRSFFVFWALMALPTMTVLISQMGDTVVKSIKRATIKLGNVTILPGNQSYRDSLRSVISDLSCGFFFKQYTEDIDDDDDDNDDNRRPIDDQLLREFQTTDSTISRHLLRRHTSIPTTHHRPKNRRGQKSHLRAIQSTPHHRRIPTTRSAYHYLLILEISRLASDAHATTSKKYSFDEWAWYLRLLGEDESRPAGHGQPGVKERQQGEPESGWSWLGSHSPLVVERESIWLLTKLSEKLQEELAAVAREEGGGFQIIEIE